MRGSQGPNFFAHRCSVFESSLRFVSIPIRDDYGPEDGRKHVGKKRSIPDTEATSKRLRDALHHVVDQVGACQTGHIACVDHEFFQTLAKRAGSKTVMSCDGGSLANGVGITCRYCQLDDYSWPGLAPVSSYLLRTLKIQSKVWSGHAVSFLQLRPRTARLVQGLSGFCFILLASVVVRRSVMPGFIGRKRLKCLLQLQDQIIVIAIASLQFFA